MRLLLFIAYFSVYLFSISCNSSDSSTKMQKKVSKRIPSEKVKPQKKKPIRDVISNTNVVEKLTKYGAENPETKAVIKTTYGNIYIKLYDDTPLHRASFVMLAKRGFYDSTFFYRIHKNFVIQGGNSDSDETLIKLHEIGSYRIPLEIKSHHIHKKGALALAIPEGLENTKFGRRSSPFNFYIVQGYKYSSRSLKQQEDKYDFKVPEKYRQTYFNIGGAPHLDGDYTVFGEVTKGFSVIDKIAEIETNVSDFPVKEVYLSVEILE